MSNDGYDWLLNNPRPDLYHIDHRYEPASGLAQRDPAPYAGVPPALQASIANTSAYLHSPFPPTNQDYMRTDVPYANPTAQYQPAVSMPGYYQGQPPYSTPSTAPVTSQGQVSHLPLTDSIIPWKSYTPRKSNDGHDTKRRRTDTSTPSNQPSVISTVTPATSKPASKENISSFSFSPRDTTDRSFLKNRMDIVKPLSKVDAAVKLSYDPRTIARDVLIASGRHPTEPALNHHLVRLRDIFLYVDNSSDLETFRWDMVDMQRVNKSRDSPLAPMQGSAPPKEPSLQVASADETPGFAQTRSTVTDKKSKYSVGEDGWEETWEAAGTSSGTASRTAPRDLKNPDGGSVRSRYPGSLSGLFLRMGHL
ncbi:hypothetical protein APSETT444_008692 [Aspergillus pseudonomiae]